MVVWAVADRALDLIGLGTVIYWTIRWTRWFYKKG